MTNMPKLSARAQKALDVLANGGEFAIRLERDRYTGFEKFKYRLQATKAWSSTIKGIGFATFDELKSLGFLRMTEGGTSVSTYYKLNTAAQ